ncbi:MAG: hypothetical protein RL297_1970 [Pseudomonadota bacterium]
MDDLSLLIELHSGGERQGPGGVEQTQLAIDLSGLRNGRDLKIADIGCGTGASTLVLAQTLNAQIVAIDFLPPFLRLLEQRAQTAQLSDRITTLACSMDALTMPPHSLDAIWSEGAIYNMGFEQGVRQWGRLIKPGGVLAVSELTWLTERRPAELEAHWQAEYPEVDTASAKIAILEKNGFSVQGYFVLPPRCWLDNYYAPMRQRFPAFLQAHVGTHQHAAAQAIVAAEEREIALYERYHGFFGYGFYIARKTV